MPPPSRRYLAIWLPLLAEDCWRLADPILPGTGRGTMRSMVEGGRHGRSPPESPSTTRCAGGPQFQVGHAPHGQGSSGGRSDLKLRAGEEQVVVFTERQANAVRLTAVSRAARALGLTVGLTLADARARVPGLVAIERDHGAEARLLAWAATALRRYTPAVAPAPPDALLLDIAGCTHPYGGEARLRRDLARRLARAGLGVRTALGDTPEAARARARFGGDGCDLHALPVAALEAAPDVTLALRRAGLKTIGDLAARPSTMLAARFGDLALRLHRVLGHEDRRIAPERPLAPIFALRRFAEPIGRVEDALACVEALMGEAAASLLERHLGGRRFEARFFRSDGAVPHVAIETGRPTRDPAVLVRLLRERIDALADPIDPGFGFDLIRLDVSRTESLAPEQAALEGGRQPAEPLAALIDRLAARLGRERIARAAPLDSHIPECASTPTSPTATPAWPPAPPGEPPLRPLHLLDPPQPVAVTYGVPDGPPRRFDWRGRAHEVARWEGPERIAAEWWRRPGIPRPPSPEARGGGLTRDYYRVEDRAGHRFWLFRHGLQGSERTDPAWYVHGLFA